MITESQIKKAKPADRAYKLADAGGLHLYVTPAGSKLWRFRYEIDGREKLLSLGDWPHLTLGEARIARDNAKAERKAGVDPARAKKERVATTRQQQSETFESIAREWHALNTPTWVDRHAADVLVSLERDVFRDIGALPVRRITAPIVLDVVRKIEARGAHETAGRVRQRISAVMAYAIATGRAEGDPAAAIKGALKPVKKGRQPAVTDLDKARELLGRVESQPAHPVTMLAMRLLVLTAVRPGVICSTPWSEFDAIDPDEPVWIIPAARMKLRKHYKEDEERDHYVPLTPAALDVISALRRLTGRGPMAFPNARHAHKPMSENAMGYLINRAGYHHKHVPHGFRTTFSTIMNERFPADRMIIEAMLAHTNPNKVEGAYNRAEHRERRKALALIWSDLIMAGRPPASALLDGPRR